MKKHWMMLVVLLIVLAGCKDNTPEQAEIRVEVVDAGVRRTYVNREAISIDEFLRRIEANVGELDRIDPPRFYQIYDGLTVTIVRVSEQEQCYEDNLPYSVERTATNSLQPGVEQVMQAGENGTLRICERCVIENGVEVSCNEFSRTVITEPRSEIVYFGAGGADIPVAIEGRLIYIANGQAWLFEGNAINKQPLTTEGFLDGRVFDISPSGRQLLYTRRTEDVNDLNFSNELWAILDITAQQPAQVSLGIDNVLSGEWMPSQPFTVSYSTANPSSSYDSGYEAYNDVWVMRIDGRTGQTLDFEDVVENSAAIYGYWGVIYRWSPDGQYLACSRADSVGIVDLETGECNTLLDFAYFQQAIESRWIWRPEIYWSQDSKWLITTTHGAPYGGEAPTNSVVFNVAVIDPVRRLVIDDFIEMAGIWAAPQYSPIRYDKDGFPEYQIAYLQARDPLNSLGIEYDLAVADRDGSNARVIFPPVDRPGMRPFSEITEFVWSPSGTHIAIKYQGDLWVVEVESGLPQRLTTDRQASHFIWTN